MWGTRGPLQIRVQNRDGSLMEERWLGVKMFAIEDAKAETG